MSRGALIRRNSLFALLSQFVRLLTNVVLFIGIARLYGPVDFGQFTAAHTLSTIFILVADFGFDILLTSEIARQRARATEVAHTYLSMKILFAVFATLAMAVTASLQHVSDSTRTLMYVFSLYVLFSSLTSFFYALFKGFDEFHHETKISFLTNLLLLLLVVILGVLHAPLTIAAAAFVLSRVLSLGLVLIVGNRFVTLRTFRFRLAGKAEFAMIAVFGIHAIFSNLFFTQDTILLSIWRGDHDVGVYQSVFKLITVIFVIPDVLMNALLPSLSRYHEVERDRWSELGQLLNKTLFLVGLPIAVLLFVYADQVIHLLYGETQFAEAIPVLRIFACIVFFHFAAITFALMLTTARRQAARMVIVVLATLFNFVLNSRMIPHYGTQGAAVVSLTTIVLVGLGYMLSMGRLWVRWMLNMHHVIPVLLSVAAALVLWQVRTMPVVLTLPPACILFGAMIYFVGYTPADRRVVFAWRVGLL